MYNYILYRSSSPTIDLNSDSPIANVTDTLYTDPNPPAGEVYYFIVAQDIHNNLSPITAVGVYITVDIKVFLEGPYNSPNMSANLTVPVISPYDANAIAEVVPATAVDWALVELRENDAPAYTLVASKSAFLLADGSVVDIDFALTNEAPVKIEADAGTYFVVVKHRNHLGVMSATAVAIE